MFCQRHDSLQAPDIIFFSSVKVQIFFKRNKPLRLIYLKTTSVSAIPLFFLIFALPSYIYHISYMKELALKYGCNPNQKPSRIYMEEGELPITVLSGRPGYINFLDALQQLAAC